MAVRSAVDVWTGGVDRGMDHIGRGVEESAFAAIDDLAGVVDEDEVGLVDQAEGDAEGVHPEAVGLHWVAHRDVAGDALGWPRHVSTCLRRTGKCIHTSSKPYFPKIRNAAASLPFKYSRSLYLSSNFGGLFKSLSECRHTSNPSLLDEPRKLDHLPLRDILLNTRLHGRLPLIDGDSMAIRRRADGRILCVWCHGGYVSVIAE